MLNIYLQGQGLSSRWGFKHLALKQVHPSWRFHTPGPHWKEKSHLATSQSRPQPDRFPLIPCSTGPWMLRLYFREVILKVEGEH